MKPKGFRCPNCECALRVIRTTHRANGVTARRRACPQCGRRVTTEERPKTATNDGRH